jgi:hypothetical protein
VPGDEEAVERTLCVCVANFDVLSTLGVVPFLSQYLLHNLSLAACSLCFFSQYGTANFSTKTNKLTSTSSRQQSVVFGRSRFQISVRRMAFVTRVCMIVLSPPRQIAANTEIEL